MNNNNINTEKLKIAEIRYFDTKYNGVEIPPINAYAFLYQFGNQYRNIFKLEEELPVYDRVPYSNTTRDGLDYGTKIVLVSGECKDGPCYVMEKLDMKSVFGKDKITMEQLEDYVLKSKYFFIDREDIRKKRHGFSLKAKADRNHAKQLEDYLATCGEGCKYHR